MRIGQAVIVDDPPVDSNLQGVISNCLRQIIHELVYWDGYIRCRGESNLIADVPEADVGIRILPGSIHALPHVGIPQIVDQGWTQQSGISNGNTLIVGAYDTARWLPGKLWGAPTLMFGK